MSNNNADLCPYVSWTSVPEGNSCMLEPPEGISQDWELYDGVPRASTFGEDACFRMLDRHPRNIALLDSLMNLAGLVVVHERVVAFLRAKQLMNVEFLPVAILNHKGRIASRDYSIVHPVHPQDCLDIVASGATFSAVIPTEVMVVDKLVVDSERIESKLRIFRIANFGVPVVLDRQLASEITQARFTGVTFTELDHYGY